MSKPDILSFLNDEFLMPQPEVLEHSTKRESLLLVFLKNVPFKKKEYPWFQRQLHYW